MRNPFSDDIFPEDGAGAPLGDSYQAEALASLSSTVPQEGEASGRALVLKAPRAGFGKTHLVTRFAQGLAGKAFVVPLVFDLETPPRWTSVLWSVVEKLHRDHGHRSGLTLLDETARFLFARVNQRLIQEGKIPCAHPQEAVAALDRNYMEMFDFANASQPVAKWFGEHFESLAPMSSESLAAEAAVDPASISFWLRVLVSYAQAAGETPERRLEALRWAVNTPASAGLAGGGMTIIQESGSPEKSSKEKLRDLGRLLGLYRPLVLVIDHLDAFYRDGQTGLRIAYFVGELRRLLPRSLTVVSVNQDLWQATFQNHLPSALEDRLAGATVPLRGLTPQEALHLIESRLAETGVEESVAAAFQARLKLNDLFALMAGQPVSPRVVLRFAAARWAEGFGGPAVGAIPGPAPASIVITESAAGELFNASPPSAAEAAAPAAPGPDEEFIPASSVVGEDTLDSISAALSSLAGPEEKLLSVTGQAEGKEVFQRLRDQLGSLRPAAGEKQPSAEASPSPASDAAEAEGSAPSGNPLIQAFVERLRRRSSGPVAPSLDLERLSGLLKFAGQHFPVVRASELSVPGTSGTALQWLSSDAEILVGLEPATRPIFWSALTAHAAARVRVNGGLPVKVVAFTDRSAPAAHPATQGSANGFMLDLVEPTATDLAEIAAAGDLLAEIENGRLSARTDDFLALLAQELDPFWRRLTRLPLGKPSAS